MSKKRKSFMGGQPLVTITTPPVFEEQEPGTKNQEPMPRASLLENQEPRNGKWFLIWHAPIALGSQIIYPGDPVDLETYRQIPVFLRGHFWEEGRELEPRVFKKIAAHLQKYFKEKK